MNKLNKDKILFREVMHKEHFFHEDWFQGSLFNQKDIDYIIETKKEPVDVLWLTWNKKGMLNYDKIDLYDKLDQRIPYLVGIHCAGCIDNKNGALGILYPTITVIDPQNLKVVAEYARSHVKEDRFNSIIDSLLGTIPMAVLIIEKKNITDRIIERLLLTPQSSRVYYNTTSINNGLLLKDYGIYVDDDVRKNMMKILTKHISDLKERFVGYNVITDLTKITQFTPDYDMTKIDGMKNMVIGHSLMSYLIALYAYYYGNNLGEFDIYKGPTDSKRIDAWLESYENRRYYNYDITVSKCFTLKGIIYEIDMPNCVMHDKNLGRLIVNAIEYAAGEFPQMFRLTDELKRRGIYRYL